jgi:hypothetical protein
MSKNLSDSEVTTLLRSLPTGQCWSGRMYLGSMFILDFGERILMPRLRSSPVSCGASILSVRNCCGFRPMPAADSGHAGPAFRLMPAGEGDEATALANVREGLSFARLSALGDVALFPRELVDLGHVREGLRPGCGISE